MALASRVRALEEEKNGLMERLEEEEERAKELGRQIQTHTQQVNQRPQNCCFSCIIIFTKTHKYYDISRSGCQGLLGYLVTCNRINYYDIYKPLSASAFAAGRAS